jgi:hypothetical protein
MHLKRSFFSIMGVALVAAMAGCSSGPDDIEDATSVAAAASAPYAPGRGAPAAPSSRNARLDKMWGLYCNISTPEGRAFCESDTAPKEFTDEFGSSFSFACCQTSQTFPRAYKPTPSMSNGNCSDTRKAWCGNMVDVVMSNASTLAPNPNDKKEAGCLGAIKNDSPSQTEIALCRAYAVYGCMALETALYYMLRTPTPGRKQQAEALLFLIGLYGCQKPHQ